MKVIKLPLFWKFTIISALVVIIFGTINIYLLWSSVYKSFESEIDKRCTVLAKIVAEKSITPIVYEDVLQLNNILNNIQQSDSSVIYIFVLNQFGQLIAKSYDSKIPVALISANKVKNGRLNIETINSKNYKYKIIRDIAFPILNSALGTVRIGVAENNIREDLIKATTKLIAMISIFFFLGLVGALFFSYIITKPIKFISSEAQALNLNSIEEANFNNYKSRFKGLLKIYFYDEMDGLVVKFSEMLLRLKDNYIELKKTQRNLIQAEKLASLGTLSAGVAHEINNPLSGMKNCANRIIKDPDNIKQNGSYAVLIKEATTKIEKVVQRLLNFSRKNDVVFNEINLIKVIESAILMTSFKLKKNKITITRSYRRPYFIFGSASHLEQVFVNLILNSIDAIAQKSEKQFHLEGIIEIKIESKQDKLSLHFIDNGIGIDPEIQNMIFDPFFTSKAVNKGTGLGLSVSYGLIKEHQGAMYLNNEFTDGTEFIIELPMKLK